MLLVFIFCGHKLLTALRPGATTTTNLTCPLGFITLKGVGLKPVFFCTLRAFFSAALFVVKKKVTIFFMCTLRRIVV